MQPTVHPATVRAYRFWRTTGKAAQVCLAAARMRLQPGAHHAQPLLTPVQRAAIMAASIHAQHAAGCSTLRAQWRSAWRYVRGTAPR